MKRFNLGLDLEVGVFSRFMRQLHCQTQTQSLRIKVVMKAAKTAENTSYNTKAESYLRARTPQSFQMLSLVDDSPEYEIIGVRGNSKELADTLLYISLQSPY